MCQYALQISQKAFSVRCSFQSFWGRSQVSYSFSSILLSFAPSSSPGEPCSSTIWSRWSAGGPGGTTSRLSNSRTPPRKVRLRPTRGSDTDFPWCECPRGPCPCCRLWRCSSGGRHLGQLGESGRYWLQASIPSWWMRNYSWSTLTWALQDAHAKLWPSGLLVGGLIDLPLKI